MQSSQTSQVPTSEPSGIVADDPDVGFEGLGADIESEEFETLTNIPETKQSAVPPAATPAPANAQAPQQVQPQQTPQPPAQPAASAQTAPANGEAAPSATDTAPASVDDVLKALNENQGNLRENVIKSFTLTTEQAAALEANPMETIPSLLGDAYLRAVNTSLQYMKHIVPTMVAQFTQQVEVAKAAETEFFSMWPSLDKAKHAADIRTFANAFAQANAGIDRKTLFSLVGPAVMAKYGIAPQMQQASPQTQQPAYRPMQSSAPVVHQSTVNENPFAGLGMDFDG